METQVYTYKVEVCMNQGTKVLIVDDEEKVRQLMIDTLSALGYNTFGAKDGEEALTLLDQQKMDLVIADIRMPKMTGFSLVESIKSKDPNLPVLLITGYNYNYTMEQALQKGADGFLAKPFRIGKMEEAIENLLGRKKPEDENKKSLKRILVVDDDEVLRNMLIDTLSSLDYLSTAAEDGEKAWEILQKEHFDLVITDIKMPYMDGISLMKKIKEGDMKTPVIMITAYSSAYPEDKALIEGADGYLAKPFRIERIDELMRNLLLEKEEE
jgi:DNA-binding NtrC family response regulator